MLRLDVQRFRGKLLGNGDVARASNANILPIALDRDVKSFLYKGGNKGFPAFACPVLVESDGFTLCQTTAILQYLGSQHGYRPSGAEQFIAAQMACTAADIWDEAYAARTAGRDQSGASFDVREVLDWTEEDRRLAFTTSSMKRAKLDMIRRNAIIVAGNYLREHEDVDLSRRLNEIACDEAEPSLVRQAAIEIVGSA